MQPIILSGVFRDFLTRHFEANSQTMIVDPVLRNPEYQWSQDFDRSKISIETIGRTRSVDSGKRPAIRIRYNGQKTISLAVGNGWTATPEGDRKYTLHKAGSHTLFCIGGSESEAIMVATEVEYVLDTFFPVLREQLDLMQLVTVEQGKPGALEEFKEDWVSPVTIAWSYSMDWTLRQVAPRMNVISQAVTANGRPQN